MLPVQECTRRIFMYCRSAQYTQLTAKHYIHLYIIEYWKGVNSVYSVYLYLLLPCSTLCYLVLPSRISI